MSSLAYILQRYGPESRWDGDRLSYRYQNITRFVLRALYGRENDRGSLYPNCIFLTIGEAKVESSQSLSSPSQPRPFRQEFIRLIGHMLGTGNNPEKSELKHFIEMASNREIRFKELFHHPLLQTPAERFRFPNLTIHKFKYTRWDWKQEYKRFNKRVVDFDSQIQKSIYKDAFKSLLNHEQQQGTGYKNNVVDVLRFARNAANHMNQHLKKLGKNSMTEVEIENELTKVFPTRLIDLYEFLVNNDISMDFLGPKY